MVIMYWLSNGHLQVDSQLLWQMKIFCDSAIRIVSSSTMVDKARDMLRQIESRVSSRLSVTILGVLFTTQDKQLECFITFTPAFSWQKECPSSSN